jgi:magnesium chelatase family protein
MSKKLFNSIAKRFKFRTVTFTNKRSLFRRLDQLQLSARSYIRILKVSRTIADLAGTDRIEMEHAAEAAHFRGL